MPSLLRSIAATLLAATAAVAHAQAPSPLVVPQANDNSTTALPILNNSNGQVEAFLLIESSGAPRSSLDRIISRQAAPSAGAGVRIPLDNGRRLSTSLSLESNPTIGLLCDRSALARSFGSLAQHCMVASLASNNAAPLALSRPGVRVETRLEDNRSALSASLGINRFDVDAPLVLPGSELGLAAPSVMPSLAGNEIDQEDLSLLGELRLGQSGWVSIGGTLARARIVPASQLPGGLPPEWNSGTITVGGGVGNFGGEIIGRVIDVPGSPASYTNIGLGVTWRAPWKARFSVGAENLVSSGRNPFAPPPADEDESTRIPYIRYEQDL